MKRIYSILICIIFAMNVMPSIAQEQATVPDVKGLSVPEAAALLNEAGFALGSQSAVNLAEGNGQPAGTIVSQSIEAGTLADRGVAVDIGILRSDNVRLVYDDNDLTLVNMTNNVGDITGLRFVATEGTNPASFAATRWGSNVREQRCLQLWSIAVRNRKIVSGCEDIQWLSTNATGEHFWTQANGVQQFAVVEDGVTRATCMGAPTGSQDSPTQCAFYLNGAGSADDITSYLYFVYSSASFAVVNQSPDRWMPTDRSTIYNYNPNIQVEGVSINLGDANLFTNADTVANVTQLAPGQCLILTADNATPTLREECNIIAQQSIGASVAFWLANFEVESATDGQRHRCPAAVAERITICIIPQ